MKTTSFIPILILMLLGIVIKSTAQQSPIKTPAKLQAIDTYHLEVTYDKTTHVLFPSAIRYVDLGSDNLVAGKADDAENVLRVKAALKDFEGATNFSVITDNGSFYSFEVLYSLNPVTLNYRVSGLADNPNPGITASGNALFEELGGKEPSRVNAIMEAIYRENRKVIRHIGSRDNGIQFLLRSIHAHGGQLYFHTVAQNKSHIPFEVAFVHFKIVDKASGRKTVVQEKQLDPLRTHLPSIAIGSKSTVRNVYVLDGFTITDKQVLMIELYEKDGARHQSFAVENTVLNRAKPVNDLQLKIY